MMDVCIVITHNGPLSLACRFYIGAYSIYLQSIVLRTTLYYICKNIVLLGMHLGTEKSV